MPTYEYGCVRGHHFEVEQSVKDAPKRRCPVCKGRCRRLISKTSFHLKGTGWAKDGYSPSGTKEKK